MDDLAAVMVELSFEEAAPLLQRLHVLLVYPHDLLMLRSPLLRTPLDLVDLLLEVLDLPDQRDVVLDQLLSVALQCNHLLLQHADHVAALLRRLLITPAQYVLKRLDLNIFELNVPAFLTQLLLEGDQLLQLFLSFVVEFLHVFHLLLEPLPDLPQLFTQLVELVTCLIIVSLYSLVVLSRDCELQLL